MPNMFHRIKKIASGRYLTKIKEAYIFQNGEFHKVWSGASEVSYYDGDTLLGTEDVDEGEDVLHPSINTSKSGYTLYGWTTVKGSENRTTSLLATGEPMSVYAIYLPNTLRVASCALANDGYWTDYSNVYMNAKYVSGGIVASAQQAAYGYSHSVYVNASASCTLNLGKYQSALINYRNVTGNGSGFNPKFDGIGIGNNTSGSITVNTQSSSHSVFADGWAEAGSWISAITAITDITLSNPIAWS